MDPLQQELEAPDHERAFGTGWISGVLALTLALVGFGAVLCLRYPDLLTVADARRLYNVGLIRLILHLVLIAGFLLGVLNVVLRKQRILGFTALSFILLATILGGSRAENQLTVQSPVYLGLDWFLLNLLFTGILFIPIERLASLRKQPIFRHEWREDLLYFLISSLFVQGLTYLSMAPSLAILDRTDWGGMRSAIASQPLLLQFLEIMFLTDLVQYWVHRMFHRVPFLWRFHAVHHSARAMDWLAGSRMHVAEIVILRGLTVVPMYILGFASSALYSYLFFVYLFSTLIHSNLGFTFGYLRYVFVTPFFHHWHHGIEREAIDVNFAVHFPILDKLFGTYYLPDQWPSGYGIKDPMPHGWLRQFLYPFMREAPVVEAPGHAPQPKDTEANSAIPGAAESETPKPAPEGAAGFE